MSLAVEELDEFWEDFLPLVEEKRVIPIIGPDLLVFDGEGGPKTLYRIVAERLAERLKVDMQGIGEGGVYGLNDVRE